MEKNTKSKTNKNIFLEKYPIDDILNNPLKLTEAFGYLECLEQFLPSDSWIEDYKRLAISCLAWVAYERCSDNG